jgi:hypothetical protein
VTGGPLARIERAHGEHRRLCDAMEALADALPRPARCEGAAILRRLPPLALHRAEEGRALFPLLRLRCAGDEGARRGLAQLDREHRDTEGAEVELADVLQDIAAGRTPAIGFEGAGYVLRGFFEAKRRHMSWEEIHVLPLARDILGAGDLDMLEGAMGRMGMRPGSGARGLLAAVSGSSR